MLHLLRTRRTFEMNIKTAQPLFLSSLFLSSLSLSLSLSQTTILSALLLIVVLEFSSVQVPIRSQFSDFLLAHLFSGRFQRRSVQLANLLDSLLISLFLRDEENGNAKPGGDAQHRGNNGR